MSLKKKLATSLATISLVGALVGGATFAYLTDVETNASTFTAGKVDLAICPEITTPIDCMVPGDKGSFPIVLTNADCASLYWRAELTKAGDGELDEALQVSLSQDADGLIPIDNSQPMLKGETKTVYVNYYLPETAGNNVSHDVADVTVKFDAIQSDNNPFEDHFGDTAIVNAEAPDMNLP